MSRTFSIAMVSGIRIATCSDHGRHSFKDMRMATVLVVEDEERLRATLAYNLRKAGYQFVG